MTIPGSKSIRVDGKDYPYILKFGSKRFPKETPSLVALTLQVDRKAFVRVKFRSKLWTEDHENDVEAPIHKNSFTPSDIASVIKGLRNGVLVKDFDLPAWKIYEGPEKVK